MKLSLTVLGAGCAAALALFACADSEESSSAPIDTADGSALPPSNDAGVVDPPADAAAEADVVTPAKVCSDSQLCHLALPVKENLVAVWADGAGVAWSVTTEGSILKLEAGAWKVHATKLGPLVAIWGSSPTDIWAAGEEGIYHSTGGAFTESTLPGAFPTKVTSIWGTAANDVWATGDTENNLGEPVNTVLRFNGTAWAKVTVPTAQAYYKVWAHPGSGIWLAGSRPLPPPDEYTTVSVVLRRAPGKTTFSVVALPTSDRFPDSPILDALRDVRGASTPNGTTTWIHAVSVSSYPGIIKGTSADNGATFTWTYEETTALTSNPEFNAVFPVTPNDGWAVGEWGQVRRWDGTTWKPQAVTLTNLPVINELNAVWATADRATIVGNGIAMEWRKP
jgi:hypothetical protein